MKVHKIKKYLNTPFSIIENCENWLMCYKNGEKCHKYITNIESESVSISRIYMFNRQNKDV